MRKVLFILITLNYLIVCSSCAKVVTKPNKPEILLLAIGNSFTDGPFRELIKILKLSNENCIIAEIVIGGASLKDISVSAEENFNNFSYTEFRSWSNEFVNINNCTFKEIIYRYDWNIIFTQQLSSYSLDYKTFQPYLNNLYELIKELRTMPFKFGLQMTWAYSSEYFNSRKSTQDEMYKLVVEAYKEAVESNNMIDFLVPSGTAIQNARGTPLAQFDHELASNDYVHLGELGNFIVAMTWYTKVFNKTLSKDLVKQCFDNSISDELINKMLQSVNYAIISPYNVTKTNN